MAWDGSVTPPPLFVGDGFGLFPRTEERSEQAASSSSEIEDSYPLDTVADILVDIGLHLSDEPFPSLQLLIDDYRSRNLRTDFHYDAQSPPMSGYERPNPDLDKKRLLLISKKFYETFCEPADSYVHYLSPMDYSFFDPKFLIDGDVLYVHADFHGDLVAFLAIIARLKELGFLDADYKIKAGKKVFFLGDYTGRGVNDIEILSILFLLKIQNPVSFFPLHGNHEDLDTLIRYTSDAYFFDQYRDLFEACFRALPACMSGKGREGEIFFTHAGYAPTVDLHGCTSRKPIPKLPVVAEFNVRKGDTAAISLARSRLQVLGKDFLTGKMTTWARGCDSLLNPTTLRNFLVANGFDAMFRGHDHIFGQTKWGKKVTATTLPTSTGSGYFLSNAQVGEQKAQSVVIQVNGKAENWAKRLDRGEGTGLGFRLKLDPVAIGLFEPFVT